MQTLHERCCGLDVHKKTVVACVITPEGQETQTFGTMTFDLLKLSDWLTERGVTHVAMESSGVYWRPIVRREAPRISGGEEGVPPAARRSGPLKLGAV